VKSIIRAIFSAGVLAALAAASSPASAQTSYLYWISVRSFVNGNGETFVVASPTATDQQTAPLQACDGNVYYLAQADFGAVQTAIAGQATVQLNIGQPGTTPDASAIACMIQAAP
jgi:hypothetical protein